ncbi:MAG: putative DNA binding domain-containing protein [Alphaproteobacteria bacterium]|nr:putative DNA binding domain-containing protein [Alphaproteobacteria bacterium]MCY4318657.1 putative DNA binding domain-containing protein [Alphaproteobacteria bacterium]
MSYRVEEIESRLRSGEDSGWEFKQVEFAGDRPRRPTRDDWADEFTAFSNATGGVVLAGVADDGNVIGMSRVQITNLDSLLVEVSTDTIKPPLRIRTHHKELSDGKLVLLVEVPEGDSVHESPGGCYIRVGASKRLMTGDERLRLAQRRSQARFLWFDKQPVPETGFKTLAEALWRPLLSAEGAAEPEAALGKLALLEDDEAGILRATVAGVLLCTPNPERWLPNACITATRYRGGDRASGQIDAQEITGPLNEQIAGAVAFAARNMQVAARKDPARSDLPQYSEKALFEALVNAVVHRDYSMRGSKIRLSMFDNRVEIQSPGSLPNNLTVESMALRQSTRNEALTSVMARMPIGGTRGGEDRRYYMERRGDGVPIIQRETWQLCGKYPEYEVVDDSEVLLVVPAATHERSPARAVVSVRSGGRSLPGTNLLLLFPNRTWKRATTDDQGEAAVDLHTTQLPMTVFASAPEHAATLVRDWIPSERALAIDLEALPAGGSVILPEATGHLPGLKGRLNPIRDSHDRTYLYASNIAIGEGKQQPVHFIPGEELQLTDAEGAELRVRIIDIVGRSALVEYFDARRRLR